MANWKKIEEYETYEVSDEGEVYSHYKGGLKALQDDKDGYKKVTIFNGNKGKCIAVHRLVAMHFIENPFNKPYVNHIDGNKSNNKASNLEWCTQSENEYHAHDTGLKNTRTPVVSYVNGVKEQEFESTISATKWLRENGYPRASRSSISECCNNKRKRAYGREWRWPI